MGASAGHLVVVIEQQRLYREAMCEAIDAEPDLACRAVDDPDSWPADLAAAEVGTVVLASSDAGTDLVEAVRTTTSRSSQLRVVAIASYVDECLAAELSDAGAAEVLSSGSSMLDVVHAIRNSPDERSTSGLSGDRDRLAVDRAEAHDITARQLEVLRLLATGATPKEIAHQLGIKVGTCRDHLKALRKALGCASSTELLVSAARFGLLPELSRPTRQRS